MLNCISSTVSSINTRTTAGLDLGLAPGEIYYGGEQKSSSNDTMNVNLNFTGLPSTVSTQELASLLTKKSVIDALVNNTYYQSANKKATVRYNGRVLRSG